MTSRFIAMLALEGPGYCTAAGLIAEVRRSYPRYQAPLEPAASAAPGEPLMIQAGAVTVTVMFIDRPIPPGTLDAAIATDRVWPQAAERLGQHKAHAIVTHLQGATTHAEALLAAATVQVLAAALGALLPTIGAYWGTGDTVTETSAFQAAATSLVAGNLPTDAWVQMRWLDGPRTDKGERTLAVLTTGLMPFLGREIEFQPATWPPAKIAGHLISLMQYLLQNGLVIGHRESFGFDEETRVGAYLSPCLRSLKFSAIAWSTGDNQELAP